MSRDDADDLAYNPFADDDSDDDKANGSNLAQGYYSSAFFPDSSNLRRRRSSGSSKGKKGSESQAKRHARALTEIQVDQPNSPGLHPLRSALAATIGAVFQDTGITRPSLSRLVNEVSYGDHSKDEDEDTSKTPRLPEQEISVIVHQITPKDSLAGVSLKYGITLANLRRANQLWTSDSIHRRSVLYIPIDQASRAREYVPEPKLISLTPDPSEHVDDPFDHASVSSSSVNGDNSETVPTSAGVPILKVPASQLTYFPPSSNKIPDSKLNGFISTPPTSPPSLRTSPTSKYDPSLPNHSLTSILTALPIAASTREEIITRLSFDSVSSSFTDKSRTNSDEANGHELGEVGERRGRDGSRSRYPDDFDESMMPTPKARPQNARLVVDQSSLPTSSSSLPKSSHIRSLSSSSQPPRFYVSQAQESNVRTSQMEPSPGMQIPVRRSTTVGPTAGKRLGGMLERTSSYGSKKSGTGKDRDLDSMVQRMQLQDF